MLVAQTPKHIFYRERLVARGESFTHFDLLTLMCVCSGHCKKLAPEYAAAAAELATQNPPIYIAKVDATENNALAERFEVKGFPTLIWFR